MGDWYEDPGLAEVGSLMVEWLNLEGLRYNATGGKSALEVLNHSAYVELCFGISHAQTMLINQIMEIVYSGLHVLANEDGELEEGVCERYGRGALEAALMDAAEQDWSAYHEYLNYIELLIKLND